MKSKLTEMLIDVEEHMVTCARRDVGDGRRDNHEAAKAQLDRVAKWLGIEPVALNMAHTALYRRMVSDIKSDEYLPSVWEDVVGFQAEPFIEIDRPKKNKPHIVAYEMMQHQSDKLIIDIFNPLRLAWYAWLHARDYKGALAIQHSTMASVRLMCCNVLDIINVLDDDHLWIKQRLSHSLTLIRNAVADIQPMIDEYESDRDKFNLKPDDHYKPTQEIKVNRILNTIRLLISDFEGSLPLISPGKKAGKIDVEHMSLLLNNADVSRFQSEHSHI